MRKLGVMLLLIPLFEETAFTSKYTGPQSADVRCEVVRVSRDTPASASLEWSLKGAEGDAIVEAKRKDIVAFDDNGWGNNKKMVPAPIFVRVPVSLAKKGQRLLVHLDFGPKYDGRSVAGSVITSRLFLEHKGPPKISKEQAVRAASESEYNATWSTVALIAGNWHVYGNSKSASPPMYFVVDGADGAVVFRDVNSDVHKPPVEFKKSKPLEQWHVMGEEWTKR